MRHRKLTIALASLAALTLCMLVMHAAQTKTAQLDARYSARIVARRSLRYRAPPDPGLDRPAHVRAASGLTWVGELLAVVQDDANFVALVDPASGQAADIPLPPGDNGQRLFDETRKTKHLKLDFESCFTVPSASGLQLIAVGSGSKPARERILLLDFIGAPLRPAEPRVLDAASFYAQLHRRSDFSGSELNLEGVVLRGQTVLLFQRGNGAKRGDRRALNAIAELEWSAFQAYLASSAAPERVPPLGRVTQYDLGVIADVAFTFTDATLGPDGRIFIMASAEDSSDSVTDGLVHGTRIGELARDGTLRMTPLLDERGLPSRVKAEGIALDRRDATKAWLVVDMDDPALASELLQVELAFPAFRP